MGTFHQKVAVWVAARGRPLLLRQFSGRSCDVNHAPSRIPPAKSVLIGSYPISIGIRIAYGYLLDILPISDSFLSSFGTPIDIHLISEGYLISSAG